MVIAVVGERVITRSEFEAEVEGMAARSPGRAAGEEDRRRLLESMIEREVLLTRAREARFDQRPDIVALVDQFVANRFAEEQLAQRIAAEPSITDSAVSDYYQAHPDEFRLPPAVRAGVIFLKAGLKMESSRRAEVADRAESIRAEAAAASDAAFRGIVQRHSDDQSTRYAGGDTGWIEEGRGAGRWPPAVVKAAFALESPGELAPVVDADTGFYIVRLAERREAAVRPLDEVCAQVAYHLQRQGEAETQRLFLEEMKGDLEISINETLLQSMHVRQPISTATVPSLPGS